MFSLTTEQYAKLEPWLEAQNAAVLERQRSTLPASQYADLTQDGKVAYTGVSGGALTYKFTPTSLGTVVVVVFELTGEELDLTDYDMW
jgi:hypothetical protein